MFSQINEPAHNLLKALKSHRNLAKCLFDWWAGVKQQINFGHLIIKKMRYCCIVINTSYEQSFNILLPPCIPMPKIAWFSN